MAPPKRGREETNGSVANGSAGEPAEKRVAKADGDGVAKAAVSKAPAPAAVSKAPVPAAVSKAPAPAAVSKAPAPAAVSKAPAPAAVSKAAAPAGPAVAAANPVQEWVDPEEEAAQREAMAALRKRQEAARRAQQVALAMLIKKQTGEDVVIPGQQAGQAGPSTKLSEEQLLEDEAKWVANFALSRKKLQQAVNLKHAMKVFEKIWVFRNFTSGERKPTYKELAHLMAVVCGKSLTADLIQIVDKKRPEGHHGPTALSDRPSAKIVIRNRPYGEESGSASGNGGGAGSGNGQGGNGQAAANGQASFNQQALNDLLLGTSSSAAVNNDPQSIEEKQLTIKQLVKPLEQGLTQNLGTKKLDDVICALYACVK
eukprot:gene272-396_t